MTTIYLNHCHSCGKELTDEEKAYSGEHDCVGFLRAELERVREENRWIPISERLPELNKLVNVVCEYDKERYVSSAYCNGDYLSAHGVILWRPLPTAPEEG